MVYLGLELLFERLTSMQFRESGCENCPFFKMDEDHERVVDCTTPNFNGYAYSFTSNRGSCLHLIILSN